MNNYRFINSLNAMGENYALSRATPTVLYPQLVPDIDPETADEVGDYLTWLGTLVGLSGGALLYFINKNRNAKMAKCAKLIKKWLRPAIDALIRSVFKPNFGGATLGSPTGQELLKKLTFTQILEMVKQAWSAFKPGGKGLETLNNAIDDLRPTQGFYTPEELEEKRRDLRDCLKSFPNLIKEAFKRYVLEKIPSLPENSLGSLMDIVGTYLDNGDLEAFAYAFITVIGSGMTLTIAQEAARLLLAGFTDSYGAGSTVMVLGLGAALVALTAFLAAGGTLAALGAWFASTAAGAASTAAGAAGLTAAQLQRIQNIIDEVARRLVTG